MINVVKYAALGAMLMGLAACGASGGVESVGSNAVGGGVGDSVGSGGGGGGTTTGGTTTGGSTPTTPSQTVTDVFAAGKPLTGPVAYIGTDLTTGGPTTAVSNPASGTLQAFQVSLDVATGVYSIEGGSSRFPDFGKFGPEDRQGTGTGTPDYFFYDDSTGTAERALFLFNPLSQASNVRLTYSNFGLTTSDQGKAANVPIHNNLFFSYGVPTLDAARPRTGTASYSGIALATYVIGQIYFDLDGTSTLAADFARGSLTATVNLSGQNPETQLPFSTGDLRGVGTFAANALGETIFSIPTFGNGNFTGVASGRLYGPTAEEFGLVFDFNRVGSAPGTNFGAGAAGGRRTN